MQLNEFLKNQDVVTFFSNVWGLHTCHFPECALHVEKSESLLQKLMALPRLHYPQVRVFNADGALTPLTYTVSSRHNLSEAIANDKLVTLAVAPNTIKFENIDSLDPVFANWLDQLERIFSSRITLNAYFSFGSGGGIPAHYDSHHIFAIQLHGEKIWNIGVEQSESFPLAGLPLFKNTDAPPTTELTLRAGEMLYIPPGRWHAVRTESQSVHVTVGIHTPRCYQALTSLFEKAAKRHPELRADMPFIVDPAGLRFGHLSDEELDMALRLIKAEQCFSGNVKHE
jgi:mannose-6-phosphate isomerase-like protein (cupin superfamily)